MSGTDDDFLLGLAGVSGTMLGTFIVGVFFYIDSEMHRRLAASEAADRYLRSSVRWVFTAYSIPLLVPLVLASLDPLWGALSFIVLGILLGLVALLTAAFLWLRRNRYRSLFYIVAGAGRVAQLLEALADAAVAASARASGRRSAGTVMEEDLTAGDYRCLNRAWQRPPGRPCRGALERLGSDPRLDSTALQTVGIKGWDGLAIAVVR